MIIETKQLTKKFGDLTAVDGVELSIEAGDIVGLLGPNGAGKSTTISMIATLYKPTSGQILYHGLDVVTSPGKIQPDLGYVPQEIALYETLTGYENLKYFGGLYGLSGQTLKARIKAVSEIIGIGERLTSRVETYSGGMKRRINIGAALLHNPKIIVMDEPTVGIDPQSRNHILETVRRLNREGMTVIYTSHYMEEVESLCRQIYIMDHGKVIAQGTKEALIAQSDSHTTIRFKFDKMVQTTVDRFKTLPGVIAVRLEGSDEVVMISSGDSVQKDLIRSVMDMDLGLQSFDVLRPNLEQVFLKLTGRGLRD